MQLSWVKRLYKGSFHPWKHIPTAILQESFSDNIFFPNMSVTIPAKFPIFYKTLFKSWMEISKVEPLTFELILTQSIWNNIYVQINNKPILNTFSFQLFIFDLYNPDGDLIVWETFRDKWNLSNAHYFKWRQIADAIPARWKCTLQSNRIFFFEYLGKSK